MHPAEEALRRRRVSSHASALSATSLPGRSTLPSDSDWYLLRVEVVEVGLEPLRDAPLAIQHVGADEAAGREPARLQPLGQRRLALVEKEAAVVADAVRRAETSR